MNIFTHILLELKKFDTQAKQTEEIHLFQALLFIDLIQFVI